MIDYALFQMEEIFVLAEEGCKFLLSSIEFTWAFTKIPYFGTDQKGPPARPHNGADGK